MLIIVIIPPFITHPTSSINNIEPNPPPSNILLPPHANIIGSRSNIWNLRTYLSPHQTIYIKPIQIRYSTSPIKPPKDIKGRPMHYGRMSITWCRNTSRGGNIPPDNSPRQRRMRLPHTTTISSHNINIQIIRSIIIPTTHIGIPTLIHIVSMSTPHQYPIPYRDNLSPTPRGEMILIKIIDTILSIVPSKDVEAILDYGRSVEGTLTGWSGGRGWGGCEDGPSFFALGWVVGGWFLRGWLT